MANDNPIQRTNARLLRMFPPAEAEQKEAALLSIYHHAMGGEPLPNDIPPEFRFMDFDEAVAMIGAESDLDAPFALEWRLEQETAVALVVAAADLDKTVREAAIMGLTRAMFANDFARLTELIAIDPNMGSAEAQLAAHALLAARRPGGGAPGSCTRGPATLVKSKDYGDVTNVKVDVTVFEAPLNPIRVSRLLHPFRWKANYQDYFRHSDPTLNQGGYVDGEPVCLYEDPMLDCAIPWRYTGSDPLQYIYEELAFPTKPTAPFHDLCLYRNILQVDFEGVVAGNEFCRMVYGLEKSTYGELYYGSLYKGPDVINVDEGSMSATRIPGGWLWSGVKCVRFLDLTPGGNPQIGGKDFGLFMNAIAPAILGRFLHDGMVSSYCS